VGPLPPTRRVFVTPAAARFRTHRAPVSQSAAARSRARRRRCGIREGAQFVQGFSWLAMPARGLSLEHYPKEGGTRHEDSPFSARDRGDRRRCCSDHRVTRAPTSLAAQSFQGGHVTVRCVARLRRGLSSTGRRVVGGPARAGRPPCHAHRSMNSESSGASARKRGQVLSSPPPKSKTCSRPGISDRRSG
jgi:hypothetical protein